MAAPRSKLGGRDTAMVWALSPSPEVDDRYLLRVHGPGKGGVQGVGHRGVLGVAVARPVERHHRDGATLLIADGFLIVLGHVASSRSSRFSTLPAGLRGRQSRNTTCRGTL